MVCKFDRDGRVVAYVDDGEEGQAVRMNDSRGVVIQGFTNQKTEFVDCEKTTDSEWETLTKVLRPATLQCSYWLSSLHRCCRNRTKYNLLCWKHQEENIDASASKIVQSVLQEATDGVEIVVRPRNSIYVATRTFVEHMNQDSKQAESCSEPVVSAHLLWGLICLFSCIANEDLLEKDACHVDDVWSSQSFRTSSRKQLQYIYDKGMNVNNLIVTL